MNTKFWYLATPYTKYPYGVEAAFQLAARNAGILARKGVPIFSPIAHTHPLAMAASLDPLNGDFWLKLDEPMMHAAYGLVMLMAESWELSNGMKVELEIFQKAKKPVIWMKPGVVPFELANIKHQDVVNPDD